MPPLVQKKNYETQQSTKRQENKQTHFIFIATFFQNRCDANIQGVFSKGPTQKSSKYGIGPTQQDKMAKYTGPTQSYQMSELLTNKRQA